MEEEGGRARADLAGKEAELSGKDAALAATENELASAQSVVQRLRGGWQEDAEAQARKLGEVEARAQDEQAEIARLLLEDAAQIRRLHGQAKKIQVELGRVRAELVGKDTEIERLRSLVSEAETKKLEVPLSRILIGSLRCLHPES